MRKTITALCIAGAVIVPTTTAIAASRTVTYRHVDIPTNACVTEDQTTPCFWDAGRRGNGKGFSFWVDANGHTQYLDTRGRIWHAGDRKHTHKPCGFFSTFCLGR